MPSTRRPSAPAEPASATRGQLPPRARSSAGGFRRLLVFLRQALREYSTLGAVAPSSRALARTMTASLHAAAENGGQGPKRVLEVGPGTGSFTREVLRALRAGDELHVVERAESFCDTLERDLLAPYRAEHPEIAVTLHPATIEDSGVAGRFDFIVCGLPFNSFPLPLVRSIFRQLFDLLAPGGELVYFEYLGMSACKRPFLGRDGRANLRRRAVFARVMVRRHRGRRALVLRNLPPARVVSLRKSPPG